MESPVATRTLAGRLITLEDAACGIVETFETPVASLPIADENRGSHSRRRATAHP